MQVWNRLFGWRRRAEARATLRHAVAYLPPGTKVLDVGCGTGHVLDVLNEEMGCVGFGADVVLPTVEIARFTRFDGSHLPFRDDAFDVAFLVFVLHHADDPGELLREASRVASQAVVVVEDTPQNAIEERWGRLHIRSFATRHNIPWHGRVRGTEEWRRVFQFSGMPVLYEEKLGRFERLPPVSRTAFVVEPAGAAAAVRTAARAATS
jgi:ubiquinone/menaquinone biosynthesis C-methylase UbiE